MTDPVANAVSPRPLPRWVAWVGFATIIAMVPLVALGGQTTTRTAGMADPVWPTSPLYLVINSHEVYKEPRPGFLLEHTHRLAGYCVGCFAIVFAVSTWLYDRNKRRKTLALLAMVATLGATIAFMVFMFKIKDNPQEFGPSQAATGILAAVAALVAAVCSISGIRSGEPGAWPRALAMLGLIGVMIQGLLGGLRVMLDYWFGDTLAPIHGCFAHVVVCMYFAAVVLCAPVSEARVLSAVDRKRIGRWILFAIALVFLQLIFGALTRHWGTALFQRLHMLTAFAATAVVVLIATLMRTVDTIRKGYGGYAYHLLSIVFIQVALGVEAYMGKFASVGAYANIEPRLRPITNGQAYTRTAHVLIGLTLLASLVALAVRVYRQRSTVDSVQHKDPLAVSPS